MIDPFRLCVAFGPLAIYLLVTGLFSSSRTPRVMGGAKDLGLLGFGLSGLMIIGPIELFLPEAAAIRFGAYIWVLLGTFYALCVALAMIVGRPRLVVYNIRPEELRPVLSRVASELDPASCWAGDSLWIPSIGVQLHLDAFEPMNCVSLVSSGEDQQLYGWKEFEVALRAALVPLRNGLNARGAMLVLGSALLVMMCLYESVGNTAALAQGMRDLLRF